MAAPARSVRDLITRALRLIGAYGSGESADGNDATDALLALNQMIDGWSADNLMVYQRQEQAFALTGGKPAYAIGPTGDFITQRPIDIEYAFTRDANGIDRSVAVIAQDRFAQISLKAIPNTFPTCLKNDNAYPNATITLYPYPATGLTIYLGMLQVLNDFADLGQLINMPPGYEEAITFSLAELIAPEYDRQASATVARLAATSRGRIRSLNLPTPSLVCEFTGVANSGGDGKAAFLAGY